MCPVQTVNHLPGSYRKLAQQTGLHIVTNTGYYGGADDKFVPKHAYEESAAQLAAR